MFDMATFELQKSIMNHNRKQILEAQQEKIKARQQFLENSIDALVMEYDRTHNTEATKIINRKHLREAAVINVVKDAMYGVFESSLMIDESTKAEYHENIKGLFEAYFYQVLKENSVTTLGQFKTFVKNSHTILENVIERAEALVSMNEAVYHELLETTYNSTSLDNLIVKGLEYIGESDVVVDEKVNRAREVVDRLNAEFQRFTLEQKVASAHKIIQVAIMILRLGVGVDKATYAIVDKLLSIINSIFGKETTESLREKLHRKTLKEVESYYCVAIDVAITLKKLQKNYPQGSKEYEKMGERIVSIYKAIIIINQYRQQLLDKVNKPLNEMSYIEFITEAESATLNVHSHHEIINGLKDRVNHGMVDLDAFEGLENLKLANRILGEPNYHHEFIKSGNAGSNTTTLIIKALKLHGLPDKLKDQYVKEAHVYKTNLEAVVATARANSKGDQVNEIVRQHKRLGSFLSQMEVNGNIPKKMIRESISPLLAIDHKVGMDMLANTIQEATQYFELYEASAKDVEHVINLVNECDEFNPDTNAELFTMVRSMREAADEKYTDQELQEKCACLEAAVYKKLYMANPIGLSEAAGNELKQGKYPKLNDFLDDDEKKLIDSITSINGKDKVVNTIKSKIIGVIESEEKRIEKLEDDEQKLLVKLSKKIPEGGEALQEAVQNRTVKTTGPVNLFEAIVMNRSKKYVQESVALGMGFDVNQQKHTIMSETVTLYTIHETFNTMQFGSYHNDPSKTRQLMVDYFNNKI